MNLKARKNLLLSTNGYRFEVEFIKADNKTKRKMVATTEYKGYVKGIGPSGRKPQEHLLTVYDLENKGIRSIPLERLISVTIKGQKYKF